MQRRTHIVKRGNINWITQRTLSALDNAKVSNGMAVHVLISVAEDLGHCVNDLIINRSTIQRMRRENRKKQADSIQAEFLETVIR